MLQSMEGTDLTSCSIVGGYDKESERVSTVCRVLLSKPRLLLMDESTSALDTGNEAALYAALGKSGITYVSVGHRPSLVRHLLY